LLAAYPPGQAVLHRPRCGRMGRHAWVRSTAPPGAQRALERGISGRWVRAAAGRGRNAQS